MDKVLEKGLISSRKWKDAESWSRELMESISKCYIAPEILHQRYKHNKKLLEYYEAQNERISQLKRLRLFLDRFKQTYHLYRVRSTTDMLHENGSATDDSDIEIVHHSTKDKDNIKSYASLANDFETTSHMPEKEPLLEPQQAGSGSVPTVEDVPYHRTKSFKGESFSFLIPRDYYHIAYLKEQNDKLNDLFDQEQPNSARAIWTVRITFYINVTLTILRSLAALHSGSLSVFASTLEGCLDIVSNSIVFFTQLASGTRNYLEYPTGRSRLEPLGVMVFAAITATSTFQILLKAIQQLSNQELEPVNMNLLDGILLLIVILTKLGLWLWSRRITESLSCLALAQDHLNDVVSNTLTTIFAYVATYYKWWIDPVGAIVVALIIMKNWIVVCMHYAQLLTGRSASRAELNDLTFLVMSFEPAFISYVDTVRAYHVGINLFAEIDIVLPPKIELQRAHDIGESLQVMIERLPYVERAFVHLDTNDTHVVEHQWGLKSS